MKQTFTIWKSDIPQWGYEITAKNYHNIAPDVDTAVRMLKDRYGRNVKIRIKADGKGDTK